MRISCREILIKTAESPNKFPWNVSPSSKAKPDERDETGSEELLSDEFVKIKIKDEVKPIDKNFINWETINQLELPQIEEKEVKFLRSKK